MVEARTREIANWCAVLGVAPDAPDAVIKAAGKAQMAEAHPDKAVDEADRVRREAKAKSISEAVAELLDPRNAPRTRASGAEPRHSGGSTAGPSAPGAAPSGSPRYTTPPFGVHYKWSDFSEEEMADIVTQSFARVEAERAARQAATRAAQPSRRRTWLALPLAATAFMVGMVRWFDQEPGPRSEWWTNGLFIGAALSALCAATAIGRLRGPRRTSTLALLIGGLVAAPTTLVVALVAVASVVILHLAGRAGQSRADWSGAILVGGAWGLLAGVLWVGPAQDLWQGWLPAVTLAVVWVLAAVTLAGIAPHKRDQARTFGAVGALVSPIAAPILLVLMIGVWRRNRRRGHVLATPTRPA